LAKDSSIDYVLNAVGQHVNPDVSQGVKELLNKGASSLKIYISYRYNADGASALNALRRTKELYMTGVRPMRRH
jgi:flavorubredoxin